MQSEQEEIELQTSAEITPDATEADGVESALVRTLTLPPAVAAPILQPESVMVTAVPAASGVPPVVITMEVAPGCD